MSVRKTYNLLMDSIVVASGSYASVLFAYDALTKALYELCMPNPPVLSISFQPVSK